MANRYRMIDDKLVQLTDEEDNKKILEQVKKQEEDRESAKTKLKNLGLTDDEISALIGE